MLKIAVSELDEQWS